MKTIVLGAIAGALIVGLALTAGHQFGVAHRNARAYGDCLDAYHKTSEVLKDSQATTMEVIEQRDQLIERLRPAQ